MSCTKSDLWMPLHWGDYLRDTGHLSATEHGAYLLLIGHYWTTSAPLPSNEAQLRRITRTTGHQWAQIRSTILSFFRRDGDQWRHKRVDKEIARRAQIQTQRSAAGQASAAAQKQQEGIRVPCDSKIWSTNEPKIWSTLSQKTAENSHSGSTSVDNSTAQHLHSKKEDTAALGRTPLHCAQDAVIDALGVRNDPNWLGDAGFVECWLNSGADLKRDILPTIHRLMARRGGRPRPRSLRYFNEAIADAIATRTQPLPAGTAQPQEHRRYGHTSGTDHARAAAELLAERSAHPGATRAPYFALLAAR